MKKIFSNESLILVSHLRNVLEQSGIATLIKNERLWGALGEIPYLETWPELWVVDPADHDRAAALVSDTMTAAPTGNSWTCSACDEVNEAQFGACWHCQATAPAEVPD